MLTLENISKSYAGIKVLDGVSFQLGEHELLALLGESGSGKSTLLRIIAGFELPDNGEARINSTVIVSENQFVRPEKRDIGLIFQDYALFPHLSVRKNISFGAKSNSTVEIDKLLDIFGLADHANKKPNQLSGGQQQRVAIARALAAQPKLLLLDEPFSNLDQSLRRTVRAEIKRIQREFGLPIILVTHDPEDALDLADRVAVIKSGQLIQIDTPENLYRKPANKYVGELFGYISEWEGNFFRPDDIVISSLEGSKKGIVVNCTFSSIGNYLVHILCDNNEVIYASSFVKFSINQNIFVSIRTK